jgi:hypothetical protein
MQPPDRRDPMIDLANLNAKYERTMRNQNILIFSTLVIALAAFLYVGFVIGVQYSDSACAKPIPIHHI